MEGELFTHHPDKGVTIYELRGENGLTRWYGQEVFTDVCISKECKQIRIWLFWNGLGNYLGFQLKEGEQLTKKDHEPFIREDYQQLDQILGNEKSYFQYLEFRDLVAEKDSFSLVDGYTGATLPGLNTHSVDGAVYTCFTLWRIVYGPVRELVKGLFVQRIDDAYIQKLFAANDPAHLEEAVDLMAAYSSFQKGFAKEIIVVIRSPNGELALKALRGVEDDLLADKKFQQQLVADIGAVSPLMRAEIVWKLSKVKVVDIQVVSQLLGSFLNNEIEVNELRLIYLMIDLEMLKSPMILQQLKSLERHENAYVRRITGGVVGDR